MTARDVLSLLVAFVACALPFYPEILAYAKRREGSVFDLVGAVVFGTAVIYGVVRAIEYAILVP